MPQVNLIQTSGLSQPSGVGGYFHYSFTQRMRPINQWKL